MIWYRHCTSICWWHNCLYRYFFICLSPCPVLLCFVILFIYFFKQNSASELDYVESFDGIWFDNKLSFELLINVLLARVKYCVFLYHKKNKSSFMHSAKLLVKVTELPTLGSKVAYGSAFKAPFTNGKLIATLLSASFTSPASLYSLLNSPSLHSCSSFCSLPRMKKPTYPQPRLHIRSINCNLHSPSPNL